MIIGGLPGVGKTTVAKEVCRLCSKFVLLSSDKIRKELITDPTYSEEEKSLIYSVLFLLTNYLHNKAQTNCIIDASFFKESLRHQAIKKMGAPSQTLFVECQCSEEMTISRIKGRKNSSSDADVAVYHKIKKIYEPVNADHVVVDTGKNSPSENAEKILSEVKKYGKNES